MQIDPILIVGGILALFFTVCLTALFTNFWTGFWQKIKEMVRPAIKIIVTSALHEHDAGLFIHYADMSLLNTTQQDMRIDNVRIFDKRKRELVYTTRGHTGPITEFNIPAQQNLVGSAFCHRKPTGETNLVKLKVCVYRTGKRKICKKFESRQALPGEFPTGLAFFFPE